MAREPGSCRRPTEVRADFVTGTWVTPLEILSGNLALGVSMPFGIPRVTAGALIASPRFGRVIKRSLRDSSLVLGDPIIAALVGWHAGNFHWVVGASVNVPAGGYEEGELSNLAFNRWIGDVYWGFTYLDSGLGLDISGAVGFEINGENPATDYRSGNAFHAELSISKNLTKDFSVGLLSAYYRQVSDDGGAGNGIGPFKGEVTALGATAGYDFAVGGTPVSARIKVLREVEVENRAQGTIALFTIGFPLGAVGPRPPPEPVRIAKP
jgi:hypothetical protein